jgi:hypothetical protein
LPSPWNFASGSKIRNNLDKDILFVCGDIHLVTFPMLLKRELIDYEVIEGRVGVTNLNTLDYRALKYAQDRDILGRTDCFCLVD